MKNVCVLLLILTSSVLAIKKQQASFFDYGNANDPDKNKDFRMTTTEIRNWCPSFVRVHYTNPALTQKFPAAVRAFNESDADKNSELSFTEYRTFAKKMKTVFDEVYLKFRKEYDANRNGRLEKGELAQGRSENTEYFTFAVRVTEEKLQEDQGQNPIVEKKPIPPKAIDDIYD